jgi:hypothetical protein
LKNLLGNAEGTIPPWKKHKLSLGKGRANLFSRVHAKKIMEGNGYSCGTDPVFPLTFDGME